MKQATCCVCMEEWDAIDCYSCNRCKDGIVCTNCIQSIDEYEENDIITHCPVCRGIMVGYSMSKMLFYAMYDGLGIRLNRDNYNLLARWLMQRPRQSEEWMCVDCGVCGEEEVGGDRLIADLLKRSMQYDMDLADDMAERQSLQWDDAPFSV